MIEATPRGYFSPAFITYFVTVPRTEIDRNEGQPDDARSVHGETDEFRLVEILRNLSRLYRVDRADGD